MFLKGAVFEFEKSLPTAAQTAQRAPAPCTSAQTTRHPGQPAGNLQCGESQKRSVELEVTAAVIRPYNEAT